MIDVKKHAYRKGRKSVQYLNLKCQYDELFQRTSKNYFENTVNKLLSSKPGQAYSMLKKLGMRPGDYDDGANFMLQNHVSQSLTPQQSADAIANHFAAVSQEFPPLEFSRLPQRVQIIISETIDYQNIPRLSEVNVWEVMKKVKVSSSVLGDIPAKLLKEFSPEQAVPLRGVYSKIFQKFVANQFYW